MAKDPATVSELRKAAEITDQEIDAAVDAVLADLATEAYPLAKEWTLDVVESRAHTRATEALTTAKLDVMPRPHPKCRVGHGRKLGIGQTGAMFRKSPPFRLHAQTFPDSVASNETPRLGR